MTITVIIKAVVSRLLFLAHGILSVYFYNKSIGNLNNINWLFLTPLLFLLAESIVTIVYRKGFEYKYVWPSGFFYITTIIPLIWLIEVKISDRSDEAKKATFNTTMTSSEKRSSLYANVVEQSKSLPKTFSELGLILCLILGRWLIPRGKITRDQLSALLLGYVGNSADVLELFDVLEEPEVLHSKPISIAVCLLFSWSMYQFTLVTTATLSSPNEGNDDLPKGFNERKRNKIRPTNTINEIQNNHSQNNNNYIDDVRTRRNTASASDKYRRGRGKKKTLSPLANSPTYVNMGATQQKDKDIRCRKMHGDVFQILVTLLMQDGPFLILRLYLIIQVEIYSEMHIFFTCKNAIVVILLIYRLLVLQCPDQEDEESIWHRVEAETKLHNIQIAIENMKLNEVGIATICVK